MTDVNALLSIHQNIKVTVESDQSIGRITLSVYRK